MMMDAHNEEFDQEVAREVAEHGATYDRLHPDMKRGDNICVEPIHTYLLVVAY